jgi:competence protein ComEC
MVGSDNARSVCVILEFAGRKILLPGDLESPGMEQVAMLPKPDCDVVMAPHHGSLSGDPKVFLDWCEATWVLISGSERADSPAVHAVYGASGREVYVTAREQALEVRVAWDGGMTLSHWKEMTWELIREVPAKQ